MSAQASVAPETVEINWTKAQKKHFGELQAEIGRAQAAHQTFVNYLGEEYELDPQYKWQIGPKGCFVRVVEPPLPAPTEGDGDATGTTPQE